MDELALVIYARMYHVGISIILRNDFWTSRTNDSLEDGDGVLCYYGNLWFLDTRLKISGITTDTEKEKPSQTDSKWKTFNSLKTDLQTEQEVQVLFEKMHGKPPAPAKAPTPPRPKKPLTTPRPKKPPTLPRPKNPKGNLVVKNIVLQKPVKKEKKFPLCSINKVQVETFTSQAAVNRYIIGDHPQFRFKC